MSGSRVLLVLMLFLTLILAGCASEKGPTREEEKLFVEAYVRLMLAAQKYASHPDSLAARREAVLGELGLDEDEFAALVRQLEGSPERWVVIWEEILERIKQEQVKKSS